MNILLAMSIRGGKLLLQQRQKYEKTEKLDQYTIQKYPKDPNRKNLFVIHASLKVQSQ